MLRKILSVVLTLALIFGVCAATGTTVSAKEELPLTRETETQVSAELEVDGSVVKCIYEKQQEDYALFLDEQRYELEVTNENGYTFVYFEDEENPLFEEAVVGQSALAATSWLWGPAVVSAAKTVIAYTVKLTATVVGAYISAEAIATTINSVKTNRVTKANVKTAVGDRAWDVVKRAPKNYGNYYYEAYLYKNMVMIGRQITQYAAINRLKQGKDVFASNSFAAFNVASKASKGGYAMRHNAHAGSGDRFPHYHAYGRKWVSNRRHMPHCWFPF